MIVTYQGQAYGIELKSYTDEMAYKEALQKAAAYCQQLKLKVITLVFFVENLMTPTGKSMKRILRMRRPDCK